MNKTVSANSDKEKNIFLCASRGLAVAVFSALIISVIMGLIGLSLDDPDKYTGVFALAALFIASGIGGYITARVRGKNALICGLITGLMIIMTMVLFSLSFALGINMSLFAICVPSIIVTSMLGAVSGVGKKDRAGNKRRKKSKSKR